MPREEQIHAASDEDGHRYIGFLGDSPEGSDLLWRQIDVGFDFARHGAQTTGRAALRSILNTDQTCPWAARSVLWGYVISLAMSAKRTKGRWVVYERREGEFIILSRLFTTRAQAEKERDKLQAAFKSKWVSLGVGVVVKE